MTLESLDADKARSPCGADGCAVMVAASDGERSRLPLRRAGLRLLALEDSVSTLGVTQGEPGTRY